MFANCLVSNESDNLILYTIFLQTDNNKPTTPVPEQNTMIMNFEDDDIAVNERKV